MGDQMDIFKEMDNKTKLKMVEMWKGMDQKDKEAFVDQIAILLTIWGTGEKGKKAVRKVIEKTVNEGSTNLADIGIYAKKREMESLVGKEKFKKAKYVIEEYRFKHELPSVVSKPLF